MKRLTKMTDVGAPVIVGSKSGEFYPPECYECCIDKKIAKQLLKDAVARLEKYENLDEQGRLLELPCAIGDTVYVIGLDEENFTQFHAPKKISEYEFTFEMVSLIELFGKCIFLTREEAEAALSKLHQ